MATHTTRTTTRATKKGRTATKKEYVKRPMASAISAKLVMYRTYAVPIPGKGFSVKRAMLTLENARGSEFTREVVMSDGLEEILQERMGRTIRLVQYYATDKDGTVLCRENGDPIVDRRWFVARNWKYRD